ncbi:unnamed protein product [Urochloa humidicola]
MCDFKYRRNCGIGFYSYNEPKLLRGRMDHRGTLQLICHLLRSYDHLLSLIPMVASSNFFGVCIIRTLYWKKFISMELSVFSFCPVRSVHSNKDFSNVLIF